MKTTNTGSATYEGLGKEGKGHVSTGSGALAAQPYGFNTRFEDAPGTNPEELVAAAHASCFTMALSFKLAEAGFSDGHVTTSAEVTLEKQDDGFAVTKSALSTPSRPCSTPRSTPRTSGLMTARTGARAICPSATSCTRSG